MALAARVLGAIGLLSGAPAAADAMLFAQQEFAGTRLSLSREEPNMAFSARSIRVEGEAWTLCPRQFFGGNCINVSANTARLKLPRGFSGVVRSARPAEPAAARPSPGRQAIPPALVPAPATRTPEPVDPPSGAKKPG